MTLDQKNREQRTRLQKKMRNQKKKWNKAILCGSVPKYLHPQLIIPFGLEAFINEIDYNNS